MGSDSGLPLRIPTIDFSREELILPGSSEWESVKVKVVKALEEYGCFEALFKKVPEEIEQSIFGELEKAFDLPLETKQLNSSVKPYRGYIGNSPHVPLYESIGIDDANILQEVESLTHIFWPQGNPSFSKTIHSFSQKLSEFDETIRRMILENFGVEKYFDEHMKSTNYLLRLMKYKAPENKEAREIGLTGHTDKNVLTILRQNQIDGLEVQTKDGQWIQVKPSPDSHVVFIGDALHAWLNGRLHCAYHRVVMSGNVTKTRYSLGLFTVPNPGCIIKTPEELVDEKHPLLFKPFNHNEFVKFVYSEQGWRFEFPLKTFCGV